MFSSEERCVYSRNPLTEVICQLHFPEILTIGANAPVDFQEAIRGEFPQYSVRKEIPAPKLSGTPNGMQMLKLPASNNYQFVSADGAWRVNLTSKSITLSCCRYNRWEDFAARLDKPLAAFIKLYQPAYFERIDLRYVNAISRSALLLVDTPFRELINSSYLGILSQEGIPETAIKRCSVDTEFAIRGGCTARIHAGPGILRRNGTPDPEVKFIFDMDLYMPGKLAINHVAASIQTLHAQSYSIFRGAITDALHDAML